MFKNLPIITKLITLLLALITMIGLLLTMVFYSINEMKSFSSEKYEKTLREAVENDLKNIVNTSSQLLSEQVKDFENEEEQIKLIRTLNTPVRFFDNKSGYLFVYNYKGEVISLPAKQSLEGKSLISLKDGNNVYLIKEMKEAANNGGGFVEYIWSKEGSETEQPKLSYAQAIEGTNFWLGAGVYIDDIEIKKSKFLGTLNDNTERLLNWIYITLIISIFTVVIPIIILSIKTVIRPVKEMTRVADLIIEGDLSCEVSYNSKDELGILANTFRSLTKRQKELSEFAHEISKGNLAIDIPVASNNDVLGNALKNMSESLANLVKEVKESSTTVTTSSSELSKVSSQFVQSFEEINMQTQSAANSSNQISHNIESVATGTEEISVSLQSISASSTELTQNTEVVLDSVKVLSKSTIEIAEKSQEASNVAQKASEMSQSTTSTIMSLNIAADEISEFTSVIQDIAEQTNLLALNATIEASRAGEAGKGFAVVANEIKALATQTTQSTSTIVEKVTQVQTRTSEVTKGIEKMSSIIDSMNHASQFIKDLTTQQSESTETVVNNIEEATVGIEDISKMICEISIALDENSKQSAELSQSSAEISKNVSALNATAKDSTVETESIKRQSTELSDVALKMDELMKSFKIQDISQVIYDVQTKA